MAVTDEAIARIQAMIVAGELKPGDRLAPEKELSESLGLSRSSLREAVKALALIRVLDVRRGDGTYVTTLEPSLLLEAISFVIDLQQNSTYLEMFEVRRLLEPAASALAVDHLDGAALARLRAMVDGVDESTNVEDLVAHDLAFHAAIVQASGNGYLCALLEALGSRTARARIWRGLTEERSVSRTLAEHRAIVDALARRDAELVRSLVVVHVSGVESWLRRSLG
ncbi:MAG: FadR/GntR family transcriptional regulator [Janthinobacterium lividum]